MPEQNQHSRLDSVHRDAALTLAGELVEEIPAEELPKSGLLLLSLALLDLEEQLETLREAAEAMLSAERNPRDLQRELRAALDASSPAKERP